MSEHGPRAHGHRRRHRARGARSRRREKAISSPLLEDVSIDGATGILINITGGPDLTLHEVNEASSLIQEAAHEDANIIFGSVIDPNLSDEVRITVIATGFDRAAKTEMHRRAEPRARTMRRRAQADGAADHAALRRLDRRSRRSIRRRCRRAAGEAAGARRRRAGRPHRLGDARHGRGPARSSTRSTSSRSGARGRAVAHAWRRARARAPVDGNPLVQPDRKRAQSRPSMKAVLAGEIDTESELDVPTFIRRHNATHG